MGALIQLGFGCLFGIALASSGAADFDAMMRMFLFQETHVLALAVGTTLVAALGLAFLRRSRWDSGIRVPSRRIHRGSVFGGVLFGIGWGFSGTCPGTALAQLGSGHLIAAFTAAGIVIGNWLFERVDTARFGISKDSCS
jgi:uncharacterized protein